MCHKNNVTGTGTIRVQWRITLGVRKRVGKENVKENNRKN